MDSRISRDGELVGTGSHRDRLPEGGVGTTGRVPSHHRPRIRSNAHLTWALNCCDSPTPDFCCGTSQAPLQG